MRLVIRADGNRQIGIGHVMRMLALADEVQRHGGQVTLASVRPDEGLLDRARMLGVAVAPGDRDAGTDGDASWLTALSRERAAEWVVVDGYRFDHHYQQALVDAGLRVVFVDDHGHCERYDADIVLNQNPYAAEAMYTRRDARTCLLLGPSYAMLRREFAVAAGVPPEVPAKASRILVTLGGADPENAAAKVVDALARVPGDDLRVKIVSHMDVEGDARITRLPATADMVPLMKWADVAITGAGSTVYELCCLGVPTFVVAITRPQVESARALEREGLAIDLGWHASMDAASAAHAIDALCRDTTRRAELSRRGRERIDGLGASRVVQALAAA
jgi:UDP-2,4-diacetamido-2,4,6-trideoxy-beta-L-altropyranose hydrolase